MRRTVPVAYALMLRNGGPDGRPMSWPEVTRRLNRLGGVPFQVTGVMSACRRAEVELPCDCERGE